MPKYQCDCRDYGAHGCVGANSRFAMLRSGWTNEAGPKKSEGIRGTLFQTSTGLISPMLPLIRRGILRSSLRFVLVPPATYLMRGRHLFAHRDVPYPLCTPIRRHVAEQFPVLSVRSTNRESPCGMAAARSRLGNAKIVSPWRGENPRRNCTAPTL